MVSLESIETIQEGRLLLDGIELTKTQKPYT